MVEIAILDGAVSWSKIMKDDPDIIYGKRIKYLVASEARHEIHIHLTENGRIVGIAGIQINPRNIDQLWIKFISVEEAAKGRGFGKRLLREVYIFANNYGLKMAPGSFTEEGERLRHLHDIFDREFPNVAYHRDAKGNYVDKFLRIVRTAD